MKLKDFWLKITNKTKPQYNKNNGHIKNVEVSSKSWILEGSKEIELTDIDMCIDDDD